MRYLEPGGWRLEVEVSNLGTVTEYIDSDGSILESTRYPEENSRAYRNSAGQLHRLDGPAFEQFYADGSPRVREWWADGEQHRLDGPASEEWYPSGGLKIRMWCVKGRHHRLDGPAFEEWYAGGGPLMSKWFLNANIHRIDGPAVEHWFETGRKAEFWWKGVPLKNDDRLRAAVDPATSPKRLARLARSVDPGIAAFAAHNPSCPPEAKVLWTLTQA